MAGIHHNIISAVKAQPVALREICREPILPLDKPAEPIIGQSIDVIHAQID
jgi:hypothetical protein